MDPAVDVIVNELSAAVQELERRTRAMSERTADLRASIERGRETRADVAERQRIEAGLHEERGSIDLSDLDELLEHLRACLEAERREIELLTRREKVMSALENAPAPAPVVRVRR